MPVGAPRFWLFLGGLAHSGLAAGRQIIKDNGFEDKITLIHGKVEEVELPEKHSKVDLAADRNSAACLLLAALMSTSPSRGGGA